jgi:hypothetical protein
VARLILRTLAAVRPLQETNMPKNVDPEKKLTPPGGPLSLPIEAEVRTADLVEEEPTEQVSSQSRREDRIRKAAYEAYERRGKEPGREQEDWFDAERSVERDGGTETPEKSS